MATKPETDFPTSPTINEPDGEQSEDPIDSRYQEEEEVDEEEQESQLRKNDVASLLKKLQSSGALIKTPVESVSSKEFKCYTCQENFLNWEHLEKHLIQHVSLPSVVLDKLPSDEEDSAPPSGDENWSEEDDAPPPPKAKLVPKAPQKIDISQILKKTGISLRKTTSDCENKNSDSALSKLSGLGFTIKKNTVTVKKEPEEKETNNDVMAKLGKLGGIKLKLKSDGSNSNSFKVVNGLRDFKASDDEDEGSVFDEFKEENLEEDKTGEHEGSGAEQEDSGEEDHAIDTLKYSESDDSEKSPINHKLASTLINLKNKVVVKSEPVKNTKQPIVRSPLKEVSPVKLPVRPAVKQTPKRGANITQQQPPPRETSPQAKEIPVANNNNGLPQPTSRRVSSASTASLESASTAENVVVKQEVDSGYPQKSSVQQPLFSGQIKSERASPLPQVTEVTSTPIIARVKSDPDANIPVSAPHSQAAPISTPLLPVTKKEIDNTMTIIEINGDSNDEDDDCCVVSATPAPDIKPVVPKTEIVPPSYQLPAYSTPSTQPSFSASTVSSRMPSTPSTEKQHNFNWNAPDSKPPLDMLEKSADDIFESLLSTATKKENLSLSDASEYISLDTLGPQQTCDICNTRFTDMSLLEEHRRLTGHSKSLVATPNASTLLPYNPSSNILSSLLPVKQLAEQVGKLSTISSNSSGFTHQQNVMINIQAYPGAGGVMVPPQPYNSYGNAPGQNMHSGYPPGNNNMFGPGQTVPGQYPGQHYMGQQGYGQFQPPMAKPGYPAQNAYSSAPPAYSNTSPLQSMQQAYGQNSPNMMNPQVPMGQMGPPGSIPSQYAPTSSPGAMKPPNNSGVRIQNVQTFSPGQMVLPGQTVAQGPDMHPQAPSQVVGGQMPSPSQIRMAAGATVTGARPRMPSVRGARPSIRPGLQVHGQVRGAKPGPRMPMKRPGVMPGGPGQKRRPDMLLPGKHDNEDCQVMAMQKQRDGLPMIQSVQGAKDKLNLGSQISITKKTVNKEANAMANVLASRGISVKQKQKSRSPTPERPVPHIPNLGAGMSIKHTSKSSNFSIPEAKVGGGMQSCKICKKMFMNQSSLQVHMSAAHPQSKIPMFRCDECPASYPKSLQLQHHKRVFHNVSGPNRELGLPVVDLSQEDNLKRLNSLGIYSFIPLANREQASGCFGIPVISVHNMQNGITSSLQALGADGLLSLGPLKPLPNT